MSFASRERKRFAIEDLLFFQSIARQVAVARDRARQTSGELSGVDG
jgi:hypothetical protein